MPISVIPISGISKTIQQNVYFKIIKDIVDSIDIPYNSLIVVHKDIETTLTDNTPNTTNLHNSNTPTTISKRRIVAKIEEDYDEEEVTTLTPYENLSYPIFIDNDINTYIHPLYIKTNITISFSYVSPSKSEANRIRDTLRINISKMRNINIHELEYNILIPTEVEDFIADIYDLKSRLFSQPLEDYFREHSTKRVFLLTDTANKENASLAIYEKQIRIIGTFDINSIPEKLEIDNENNNYTITFNYNLSLDLPKFFILKYPVTICNRLLPPKYLRHIEELKLNTKEEYKKNLNYTNFGTYNLSIFEAHRQLENRIDIKFPKNVPIYDEFNIQQGHNGYMIIYSFLTTIDETNKKFLFNLKDLEPYTFTEPILNYIQNTERNYITQPYQSFLYLGLYQDDTHFDNNILTLDSNLNLSSIKELSLVKTTRVTLSFLLDITSLDERALNRLLSNTPILLIYLEEYIKLHSYFKNELPNLNITISNYYKTLLIIINHFIQLDNLDTLSSIVSIIKNDPYLYNSFFAFMYNNYPNLYSYLERNSLVSSSSFNTNINTNYIDSNIYFQRTVMFNSILALRKET